jgi:hypothetical protein
MGAPPDFDVMKNALTTQPTCNWPHPDLGFSHVSAHRADLSGAGYLCTKADHLVAKPRLAV